MNIIEEIESIYEQSLDTAAASIESGDIDAKETVIQQIEEIKDAIHRIENASPDASGVALTEVTIELLEDLLFVADENEPITN